MKRILGALMCLVLIASASAPAWAKGQKRSKAGRAAAAQRYDDSRRVYYDYEDRYDQRYEDDRSVWERSRDKITVAGGAAAGAVVGGVAGGKKGAIIGALIGAGGSAVYTYKVRDRDDDRYRRY
ncbi:MAG TPA: glycine zipper domain-containing protein [Pyrinomonadaceae bacterium]|nr:glycine zipper domain-containing protein [Pyrinomonadaceae bacterium]